MLINSIYEKTWSDQYAINALISKINCQFIFLYISVAFIFNWIGFLLLMCFCHTIASRYGALSGFGLSLAKWTLIVKHSTDLASRDNGWLWWLIMTFGKIFFWYCFPLKRDNLVRFNPLINHLLITYICVVIKPISVSIYNSILNN